MARIFISVRLNIACGGNVTEINSSQHFVTIPHICELLLMFVNPTCVKNYLVFELITGIALDKVWLKNLLSVS